MLALHCAFCVQAYDRVAPVVQDAANTASPYVKSGLKTAGDVAAPALRAVEPSLKVDISSLSVYMIDGCNLIICLSMV